MIRRKVTYKLIEWSKSSSRKPLLLRGARQVGKTHSIVRFGEENFEGEIYSVNFEKYPAYNKIFEENLDTKRIVSELEIALGKPITAGKDLLFFDEIQECPKAIKALRYFYEDFSELHVVAAGSLLEFALKEVPIPMESIEMINMRPLTFEEFLIANGKEIIAKKIKNPDDKLSDTVLNIINTELQKYFIVGGMPESVKTYIETGSFVRCAKVQSDMIATFRQYFSKFSGHSDKRCLNSVLSSVAMKVGEQIKYTSLASDFSSPTIKKAFELLETARLYSSVRSVSPAGVPLKASASDKKFKAVFLDIGLLVNIAGLDVKKIIPKESFTAAFSGKLAEQFVGQELIASLDSEIYYWSRDAKSSTSETDYLIEKDGEVIPIEVKRGKSRSLKSLNILLDSFPNIGKSYVFNEIEYGETRDGIINFLPLIYAGNIL